VTVRPLIEAAADGFRIDVAHQLADVLELPLAAAPRRDRASLDDGLDQARRQRDGGRELRKPPRVEGDERLAHVLQRVHLGFFAGLRNRHVRRRVGVDRSGSGLGARAVALSFVGPWHRSGGKCSEGGKARILNGDRLL
jgi:hypothetical protein